MQKLLAKIKKLVMNEPDPIIINLTTYPFKARCSKCKGLSESYAELVSGKVLCRDCYQILMGK